MAGLGSLIQGFQSGYQFVDDVKRNQADDEWKGKERAHKEKDWKKADDYEAERAELAAKYFPKQKDAEPTRTTGAALAVDQGVEPPPGGAVGAVAAPEVAARPLDGGAPVAAALPVANTGAAVTMPPNAPLQAGAGRGFVNPPGDVGAGRGNITPAMVVPRDTVNYSSDAGAGRGMVVPPRASQTGDWAQITADSRAAQPQRNADRMGILQGELAAAKNPETRALIQREIANEQKSPLPSAGPAPAGGNAAAASYLNNPANQASILSAAEKQFGLRHRPATPAEEAFNNGALVNVSAQGPSPVPGAKLAVDGVDVPTNTTSSKTGNLNHMLDFALESAKLDVKHGKMDGAGILSIVKATETLKREGMDRATALMGQGRFQEAQDIMNSQGDHVGITIVSSKDATFKIGKTEVPTKIVTMRKEDGSTSTVNTAQAQYQMMGMEKQIDALQKDRTTDITEKHYAAVLGEQQAAREDRKTDQQLRREQFEANTPAGKIASIEKVTGPLGAEQRSELVGISKLPEVVKTRVSILQEQQKSITQTIAKSMADNTYQAGSENAKALAEQQAAIALQIRQLTEPYMEGTRSKAGADPLGLRSVKPVDSAQAGAPKAETKPSASSGAALAATKGTTTAADKDMADSKAWIKDKLMGVFDGPGKYAEIAKTHPDAKIRAAAAALDAEYKANIAANTN